MASNNQTLGTVLSVIGLVSVPSILGAMIYNLLPCTRLQELEQLFAETEGMLHKNTEAGLLGTCDMVSGFHRRLGLLRGKIDDARAESHCATTYAQNFKKMLAGLSRRIYSLCGEVKDLRADISVRRIHSTPHKTLTESDHCLRRLLLERESAFGRLKHLWQAKPIPVRSLPPGLPCLRHLAKAVAHWQTPIHRIYLRTRHD
ncbi:hypothetical protein NUW54_g11595 [Trametes sanguinea]|uniref:Uncharacterized protein n=1 Tax=Trametes sanguinea TaxID=158606 RepID=A0ACC1NCB7_9APHY|nr:hypothetical protein NUW54_g11595 [Trametes sanguinea]